MSVRTDPLATGAFGNGICVPSGSSLEESGLKIYSFFDARRLNQITRAAITMPIIVKASPSLMTIPIIIPSHVAKPTLPLLRRSR